MAGSRGNNARINSTSKEGFFMVKCWIALCCGGVLLTASVASAAPPAPLDEKALAGRIDLQIGAGLSAANAEQAPRADDAEFVRRLYLDLAGRIPSVAEVRTFLDDKTPDKRERLAARLLESPRYVTHFTHVWRALLLPEATTNFQVRFQVPGFEGWLRKQVAKNAPYDIMVRDILAMPIGPNPNPQARFMNNNGDSPVAFYMAKEVKAENLAAATARMFLGFRLECAQCHNHPFANWKREQFWGFAAFFAGLQRQGNAEFATPSREVADKRELTIPGTERVVQATFPDGKEPKWKFKQTGREALAEWVTAADNPYFARAAANRLWAYFFGTGIVDPVDEMVGTEHQASHPELLDELAKQFVLHKFDLKYMIRAITTSQTYQRSSLRTHASQDDPRRFARMPLRGLSPEQLFDSIAEATGYRDANGRQPNFFNDGSARAQFLTLFANQAEKSTEVTTSILQALSLMNGQVTSTATNLEQSVTLAAVIDAPFMDTVERVETLFMATLSRRPTSKELNRMVAFADGGGAAGDKLAPDKRYAKALADVFWALLNSGEFMLNH
jgi:hypothetical protein